MSPTINTSKNAEKIVVSTELYNVRYILDEHVRMIFSQPLEDDSEEPALALSTTNVTDVEKGLESQQCVSVERVVEQLDDVRIGTRPI